MSPAATATEQQQMLDRMLSGEIVLSDGEWRKLVLANLRDARDQNARILYLLEGNGRPGLIARVTALEAAGQGWRWLRAQASAALPVVAGAVVLGVGGALLAFLTGHLTWRP